MRLPTPQANWPDSWRESHAYDLLECGGSDASPGYSAAYAVRRHHTLDLIAQAAAPGARVLDVAAAQGNFTLALAERGYDVTWNDLRAELADYVRAKHTHGRVAYAPGNAFGLGFRAEFDVVLIAEVIEHVAHPDDFLRQAAAMVRPGGAVVMSTPNGAYFKNRLPRFSACADPTRFEAQQFRPNADGHIFLLWPDEIPALAARAGLRVARHLLFTTPLTNGHLGTERLLRVLPRRVVRAGERLAQFAPRGWQERFLVQSATLLIKP